MLRKKLRIVKGGEKAFPSMIRMLLYRWQGAAALHCRDLRDDPPELIVSAVGRLFCSTPIHRRFVCRIPASSFTLIRFLASHTDTPCDRFCFEPPFPSAGSLAYGCCPDCICPDWVSIKGPESHPIGCRPVPLLPIVANRRARGIPLVSIAGNIPWVARLHRTAALDGCHTCYRPAKSANRLIRKGGTNGF